MTSASRPGLAGELVRVPYPGCGGWGLVPASLLVWRLVWFPAVGLFPVRWLFWFPSRVSSGGRSGSCLVPVWRLV